MGSEQIQVFTIDADSLTVFLALSVLASLLLSFGLLLVQIAQEQARARREAKAAKARRLRHRMTQEEVVVPKLRSDKHYHTFLSHVWGTGQDQMRIVKQRLLEMLPDARVFLDVDDLEEIGDLEGYIEGSGSVLVFCSEGYCASRNCMREAQYPLSLIHI